MGTPKCRSNVCTQSTAQALSRAQNTPGSLPSDPPTVPGLRHHPGGPSLCGAVQWALKGSQVQPGSQSGSTECGVARECAILFAGSQSDSPWTVQSSVLALGEAQQQSSPQLPSPGAGRNHQLPRFRQCLLPCQLVLSSGKEMLQPCSLTAPPFPRSILYAGPGALG